MESSKKIKKNQEKCVNSDLILWNFFLKLFFIISNFNSIFQCGKLRKNRKKFVKIQKNQEKCGNLDFIYWYFF